MSGRDQKATSSLGVI